ncbi:hypothetical protein [uncultured Gimesia sp.]|uniref:hypothetical protein n=1 Tax=uncultured Gimesia sp. TaxID=1678688 RepID=UPI002615A90F|nr:hypothetical protein [uncultured Gimesia sp.]
MRRRMVTDRKQSGQLVTTESVLSYCMTAGRLQREFGKTAADESEKRTLSRS